MTLGDIINDYRKSHDMSMDAFASKSGISKAYISLLEKNRHPKTGKPITPSILCIKRAADGMGMDFNLLFSMIDGNVALEETKEEESEFKNPPHKDLLPISKKRLPLFDGIACGEPRLIPDAIEVYVDVTTGLKADYVLKAHGDSMTGARIHDGDLVFIRQQPTVETGEIAAVLIDDSATLKRVYWYAQNTLLVLRAENPEFEDMEFSGQELENIKILGKAVAFQSDVR